MVRQNIKDEWYFKIFFPDNRRDLQYCIDSLASKKVVPEMVKWVQKRKFDKQLCHTIACYTNGDTLENVRESLLATIDYMTEGWSSEVALLNNRGVVYNQYAETYDEMLWVLSLAYLLDIENDTFQKLVDFIDRDKVKDYLYELIIKAKIKDRKITTEESWRKYLGIPWVFEKLRQAIKETDNESAKELIKEFVTKDWYKRHKEFGWYNSHKSDHYTYFGYWSFETAAVVKIMGLDDSSFIDCKYYPKDLVHQERSL